MYKHVTRIAKGVSNSIRSLNESIGLDGSVKFDNTAADEQNFVKQMTALYGPPGSDDAAWDAYRSAPAVIGNGDPLPADGSKAS